MDLKPTIWISSINHLDAFNEIVKVTPSWRKLLGISKIPSDFPNRNKSAIVYFSQGELLFKKDKIIYNAVKAKKRFLYSYNNLNNDLSFELNHSNIKSIEWYTARHWLTNWKWIRITCDNEILGGDFLICADGIKNTKNLFEMFNQFNEGLEISTSLTEFSGTWLLLGYIGAILLIISAVLNLVYNAIYGTINGNIGGPIVVCLMIIGGLLLLSGISWAYLRIKENSKIQFHVFLFAIVFGVLMGLNFITNHFYP